MRQPPEPHGPFEVVVLVASLVVIMTASSLIVRWDERRLTRRAEAGDAVAEARLERAWPETSRDNALIGIAFLAAPLLTVFAVWWHFFRTRSTSLLRPWCWSPIGFLLGVAGAAAVLAANVAVVVALAFVFGEPLD